MVKPWARLIFATFFGWQLTAAGKITPEQAAQLPPAASHPIDFSKEIKPLFEASCVKCHGRGRAKGDFQLDTRETLLKGGESGPALVPGNSAESHIIELVMGFDPDSVMPKKGSRLTAEQIGLLRAWIDQGAKWDPGVTFARAEPNNLKTRKPQLPRSEGKNTNPVDLLLGQYFDSHKVKPSNPVNDRTYARRVYLDTVGLLPSPAELEQFVSSKDPDKRRQLIRTLLADKRNYAIHWLTFWNDALRNDYRGTGYIDGGRKQITQWLYSALEKNMPYDQFVSALINPRPESEGFVKGIVWRGVVNASQTPQMQAAQNISQVFMGVNLKCASCHDSFINDWMLSDAYGLAGIYADKPLEMVHCDKPTGQDAPLKFIYPQLGDIDPKADKTNRLQQLAELICQRPDGRLTRTLVNRLWQKFFGRGLVEPPDDMEKNAWNPDLLDWLAEDFADHGYDIKHSIEQILTSEAYQLPSVAEQEQNRTEFVFEGPAVRRMSAEQFRDALFAVTGDGGPLPAAGYDFLKTFVADELGRFACPGTPSPGLWIWNDPGAALRTKPVTVYFRKEFVIDEPPTEAAAVVTCDDNFNLYVNGERIGSGSEVTKPMVLDLVPYLRTGTNLIAISAENKEPEKKKKKSEEKKSEEKDTEKELEKETAHAFPLDTSTPAGLLFSAQLRQRSFDQGRPSEQVVTIYSDNSWLCTAKSSSHWEKPDFVATNWEPAVELGGADMPPWNLGRALAICEAIAADYGKYRAGLLNADSLATALGRPNREQVMTVRASNATTLQALELTNGAELSELLRRGAQNLLEENPSAPGTQVVEFLYQKALGRRPTGKEIELAKELLSKPPQTAGLEDVMWSITMLPEFQLIY